jgi:hypothetical protein
MNVRHGFKRHKYGVSPREKRTADGILFDSQLEMRVYKRLQLEKAAGVVLFFTRQSPFHLPGGVRYVVDFTVYYTDGSVKFIDAKGMETAEFKTKKRMVEALYPIEITIVKK